MIIQSEASNTRTSNIIQFQPREFKSHLAINFNIDSNCILSSNYRVKTLFECTTNTIQIFTTRHLSLSLSLTFSLTFSHSRSSPGALDFPRHVLSTIKHHWTQQPLRKLLPTAVRSFSSSTRTLFKYTGSPPPSFGKGPIQ